jgi:CRP/FNR family transcriptional regulator
MCNQKKQILEFDRKILSFLKPKLLDNILDKSSVQEFEKGAELFKERQYVKVLPIILDGLVKVYSSFDEKELLLYYIQPSQSCVMTFHSALKNTPSKVFATVEEKSRILLLPVEHLPKWIKEYPDFNELFYNQYNLRYLELLNTIGHLLNDKMDKRLYDHLKKKSLLTNNSRIKMSHNQLATELGTAREVISRVLKKLEIDNKIEQNSDGIKILATL